MYRGCQTNTPFTTLASGHNTDYVNVQKFILFRLYSVYSVQSMTVYCTRILHVLFKVYLIYVLIKNSLNYLIYDFNARFS